MTGYVEGSLLKLMSKIVFHCEQSQKSGVLLADKKEVLHKCISYILFIDTEMLSKIQIPS